MIKDGSAYMSARELLQFVLRNKAVPYRNEKFTFRDKSNTLVEVAGKNTIHSRFNIASSKCESL